MQHSLQPQPHLLIVTDGRCSQAVLAFLSTTDVGRLVVAEEDVGSEVSEWGAQGAQEAGGGAEGGGRGTGCWGGTTAASPYALLHGVHGRAVEDGHGFLCSFLVPLFGAHLIFSG